jgi:hypothetical protein
MCFSAGASFAAGVVLLGAGAAALHQARRPSEWPFAGIPLWFSVQQFSEGFLWLALTDPAYAGWEGLSTHVFFLFAQVFWPLWLPFAVWKLEDEPLRRHLLRFVLAAGVLVGVFLVYSMTRFGVEAFIEARHIRYGPRYPMGLPRTILYILVVGAPLFISSRRWLPLFGIVILTTLLITLFFYERYLVSVWCFFAAVASVLIWWIVRGWSSDRTLIPSGPPL